jgi:4-hydroxy-tetrahydrodipicolinate reductase
MNAAPIQSGRPARLLVHGASGRMGQALLRLAAEDPEVEIVAAVSRSVGQRVIDRIPRFSPSELGGVPPFDVAVDFSLPEGFDGVLSGCLQAGRALVSGTTGLDAAQRSAMEAAARRIPILWSSNFSLGVAVLALLVERAAKALPDWDCDIIETHHKNKRDAPSGTALSLGERVLQSGSQPRYASLRSGDVVGEHSVRFTTSGERIELAHQAGNRDIFAKGALRSAKWLIGRAPGLYGMRDLLD